VRLANQVHVSTTNPISLYLVTIIEVDQRKVQDLVPQEVTLRVEYLAKLESLLAVYLIDS